IDYADLIVINKFEKKGSEDALRQVQKQYQRSHGLWNESLDRMPVYGTIASQFNDKGTNALFAALISKINEKLQYNWQTSFDQFVKTQKQDVIIPNNRRYYLREIAETVRNYHKHAAQQVELARKLYQLEGTIETVRTQTPDADALLASLTSLAEGVKSQLTQQSIRIIENWEKLKEAYSGD
ncbi:methylmalonyl-CoA mutase, partial [Butyricicoccus sp. 1XD8-22]